MTKHINGTWFEFHHHSEAEGKYWNDTMRAFTSQQWEKKVDEIAELGMKYIVLMNTAIVYPDKSESYFETDVLPFADMTCKNPVEALLCAADRNNINVFISCGFYGTWTKPMENMTSDEVRQRAFRAMEQLYEKYGHHKSFFGWYFPDETCIMGHFNKAFVRYVNAYSEKAHKIAPNTKTLIAPYGTKIAITDRKFVRQLMKMDVDFVAYQDEVGVKKSTPKQTARYFRRLKKAHDKAGKAKLWADIELFTFEGIVYRSALIPASQERIRKQLEAVSPYVDEILCYQIPGLANESGTPAFCGHRDSTVLYEYIKCVNGDGSDCHVILEEQGKR